MHLQVMYWAMSMLPLGNVYLNYPQNRIHPPTYATDFSVTDVDRWHSPIPTKPI